MKIVYASMLVAVLFPVGYAAATPSFDVHFFDGIEANSNSQIVEVQTFPYKSSESSFYQTGADEQEWALRVSSAPVGGQERLCTLSKGEPYWPIELDCGLKPLGYAFDGASVRYYFLFLRQEQDRYKVLHPGTGQALWIMGKAPSKVFTIRSLAEWLAGGDAVQRLPEYNDTPAILREKPRDDANVVLSRTAARLKNTRPPEDGYLVLPTAPRVEGDWIEAYWKTPTCQAPVRSACASNQTQTSVPCTRGWTRWRSAEARLLMYPFYFYPLDCKTSGSSLY